MQEDFDPLSPIFLYPFCVLLFLIVGIKVVNPLSMVLFFIFLLSFFVGFFSVLNGGGKEYNWLWKLGLPLFLVGFISSIIGIYTVDGIPLFERNLRRILDAKLTYLSFLTVPGTLIISGKCLLEKKYKEFFCWFLSGLFIISLIGYRTEILALLIGEFINFYYTNKRFMVFIQKNVFKFIVLAIWGSFLLANTNFFLDSSVTLSVFSMIASVMGFCWTGISNGVLSLSIFSSCNIIPGPTWGPRGLISYLIQMGEVTTTPTVLGIPYIDFGVLGVILTGVILGIIFSRGYSSLKKGSKSILPIHSLCLSFLLITIETGIGDAIVILYLLFYIILVS